MNNLNSRKRMLMPIGDERGMAIVIALLVLVVLSLLGTLFLTASLTESTVAANEVNYAKAFWIAEAGMQHAMKSLPDLNLSEVWAGNEDVFPGTGKGKGGGGGGGLTGYGSRGLADGSYGVQITNNTAANGFPRGSIPADDPPASDTVDGDRIVVLTATGTVQGVQEAIEMVVQLPPPPIPNIPGAVVQVSNGWNDMDVSTPVSGIAPPSEPTCPDAAGFVFRGDSGVVEGSGLDGVPVEREYDSAIDDPRLDDPDQLVAMIDEWRNDPAAVTITGSTPPMTMGTAASPQITVWEPGGSGSGGGDFTGYGILIIDQEGTFELNGNFEFYGLIVSLQIHPGGGEAFDFSGGELHGALMAVNNYSSPGGEATEIGAHSGEIEYSCDALGFAGMATGGSDPVAVLSWRPL